MSARPLLRMSDAANGLLAAAGLVAVAALTASSLGAGVRLAIEGLLAGIWAVYLLQLSDTLIAFWARDGRASVTEAVIDLLAVVVPLAGLLFAGTRDQSLYCGVWLLKPLRHSTFFRLLGRVVARAAPNLVGVTSLFGIVLFGASLIAYLIERDVQPDKFGSIPQAMWWAVVTLSTTGYGDEIPMTFAGRVLAGLVMMSGIGIFALWAGILATGFFEEVRRQDFVRNWQLVAAVPLFQRLGSAAFVEIVRALRPRVVPSGAIICRKGEAGDQMFFIVEGRVTIATPSPTPVELGPGSFFGEMALISGEPRSATVTAETEVSLLSLYSEDFQMLSSSNPEIAEVIRKTAETRRGRTPEA
ncbi:cyclic nucleotide-gated ion channel [Ensifer adhaerens]|uniref:cyclic nucleotide-gated ion channel n=1 Tax=Ensifer adhaerens TaxID=106592 RepID=UPI000CF1416F|nr:cyclic nucleotide-gated ion channel [Ensifer adhaerens]